MSDKLQCLFLFPPKFRKGISQITKTFSFTFYSFWCYPDRNQYFLKWIRIREKKSKCIRIRSGDWSGTGQMQWIRNADIFTHSLDSTNTIISSSEKQTNHWSNTHTPTDLIVLVDLVPVDSEHPWYARSTQVNIKHTDFQTKLKCWLVTGCRQKVNSQNTLLRWTFADPLHRLLSKG